MKEALKELSDEQISFICAECGVTMDELFSMDEDAIYDKTYDVMCVIEEVEVVASGYDVEKESKRCILATDIVTILGNTIVVEEDSFVEQDKVEEGSDTLNLLHPSDL